MKKSFFRLLSVTALFLLLASPKTAFEGARNGLVLWGSVVVPTLLPFMICSNVIVALNGVPLLIFPVKGLLKRFFRLSGPGSYTLISGLLCGCPLGAATCNHFLEQKQISKEEGKYLLAICNHPSPMFLLGYAAACLPAGTPPWLLLAAVYLPLLPLAFAAASFYGVKRPEHSFAPSPGPPPSFDESLMNSCEVMLKIGGYIMLFSILALFVTKLSFLSAASKAIMLGFVEITTGIKAISNAFSGPLRGVWICAAAAFGGLSGIFQTGSVIKNAGLSIRHYVVWKALHSLLTILFFILLSLSFPPSA